MRSWSRPVLLVLCLLVSSVAGLSHGAPRRIDLEAAKQRLMELERDFQLVSEEYNLVHEGLGRIQIKMGQAELEIRSIEHRMDGKKHAAIALAQEMYKAGPSVAVETVLAAESLADLEQRLAYLASTQQAHTRVFERLSVDQDLLERKLRFLDRARQEAQKAEARLAELRNVIEDKIASQQDEIATLNAAIERAERRRARQARAAAAAARAAAAAAASVPDAAPVARPAPAPNPAAQTAVEAALSQVGKPYQWGAAGPDSYDCSGLTMWAWAKAGVSLPHNSGAQYAATPRVDRSDWQPGDLLFFGSPIHHVGMYIGRGQMVEAPYSGQNVRVNSAYRSDYVGAGRPGV